MLFFASKSSFYIIKTLNGVNHRFFYVIIKMKNNFSNFFAIRSILIYICLIKFSFWTNIDSMISSLFCELFKIHQFAMYFNMHIIIIQVKILINY